ncbi:MAG: c-type cytochrome [Planctomycetota bacterium]
MIAHLIQDPKPIARPADIDSWGQLEKLASTFDHVDGLFYFTYAVCIFFFVLIAGVLAYSVVKYRRRTFDQPAASNSTHNTPLEVVWTVIPLIIVMIMFAWGWKGSLDMTVVPADARQYKAVAKQWNWTFYYPNDPAPSYGELWLEVGKPAAFTLQSTDVLHAFFVPAMRVKRDVVPGRQQTVWFTPTEITTRLQPGADNKMPVAGDEDSGYHLFCAEYCGQDHSQMYARVRVVSAEDYAKRPWDVFLDGTPEEKVASGQKIYQQLCISCHTVNGAPMTGPTWKGLFTKQGDAYVGRQREVILPDGNRQTLTVDDAYITESIHAPNAKKVAEGTYATANMTAFPDLDDRRIAAIIAYMKSLADN